jgi:hypothetical protein
MPLCRCLGPRAAALKVSEAAPVQLMAVGTSAPVRDCSVDPERRRGADIALRGFHEQQAMAALVILASVQAYRRQLAGSLHQHHDAHPINQQPQPSGRHSPVTLIPPSRTRAGHDEVASLFRSVAE